MFTPEQLAAMREMIQKAVTEGVDAAVAAREAMERVQAEENAASAAKAPTPAPQNPNAARFQNLTQNLQGAAAAAQMRGQTPAAPQENLIKIVRSARALAATKGNVEGALELIAAPVSRIPGRGGYGDAALAEELQEHRAAQAQDPAYGGFLIPDTWSDTIIELLQPTAILAQVNPSEIPNPTGTYHCHREVAEPTAYWGPPEAPADSGVKASRSKFGGLTFTEKNLWAFLIFSNKVLRLARPAIDKYGVRQLRRVFSKATDAASHFGTNTQYQPCGLFTNPVRQACNVVTVGALPDADLPLKMLLALMLADAPLGNLHWTMGPTLFILLCQLRGEDTGQPIFPELYEKRMLLGYPVVVSTQIPVKSGANAKTYLTLGDWDYFAIAPVTGLQVAYSSEASVPDESGTMRSMFGNDETAVRMQWSGDMGPTQPKAFAISDDVWTASS